MTNQEMNNKGEQLVAACDREAMRVRLTIEGAEVEAYRYDKTFLKDRLAHSDEPGFDLTAYIQCNRHRQGLPYLNVTERQLDVLMRYVPGPLGLGMERKAIARDMNVSRWTVWRLLAELKDKHPKAMETVETMRKVMQRQRTSMSHQLRSMEGMVAAVDEGCVQEEMVDRF